MTYTLSATKACSVCGNPLRKDNASGFCGRNRRCKQSWAPRARDHSALGRKCSECGSPVKDDSKTGICKKTEECRRALIAMTTASKNRTSDNLLLDPAYELDDEGQPNGPEIVDEVTIRILVAGERKVAATFRERSLAALQMIKTGYTAQEIAEHLGTIISKLPPVLESVGYEIVPKGTARKGYGKTTTKVNTIRKIKDWKES